MAADNIPTSRRNFAQIAAAGLVTAAAAPALAQAQQTSPPFKLQPLTDPAKQYPAPPFLPQSQAWPGLAGKMMPKPDHGEKSYVGSGRLAGRKALITGGDSGMGRAAAIAYAREGADVAINYFPNEEPDAQEVIRLIKDEGRKSLALPGDLRRRRRPVGRRPRDRRCARCCCDRRRKIGEWIRERRDRADRFGRDRARRGAHA